MRNLCRHGRASKRWAPASLVAALLLGGIVASPAGADESDPDPGTRAGIKYVALGDSYTAGPFIPLPTADGLACGRSDHNYPHLVAAAYKPQAFVDVSCVGAGISQLTGPQPTLGGSLVPQLDAVTPDTDVITLGVGLEDIGFAEIAVTCGIFGAASPFLPTGSPCKDHYNRNGDELKRRIDAARPKLAAVVESIRQRAPQANFFVVGYPTIVPDDGPGCWPFVPLAAGDVAWLRDITKRLNDELFLAAYNAGEAYIDVYTPSIGHDFCQGIGTKWVEGLIPTGIAGILHPNATGMEQTSKKILAAFGVTP